MRTLIKLSIACTLLLFVACVSAPISPGVGAWAVSIATPVGEQASVWNIAADGTGSMVSEQGTQALSGIVLEGDTISFQVDIDAGGQNLSLSFTGTVSADALAGEFASDFGAIAVTGTRQ